jgi:hypothetical protein
MDLHGIWPSVILSKKSQKIIIYLETKFLSLPKGGVWHTQTKNTIINNYLNKDYETYTLCLGCRNG